MAEFWSGDLKTAGLTFPASWPLDFLIVLPFQVQAGTIEAASAGKVIAPETVEHSVRDEHREAMARGQCDPQLTP
jgi:hypothetical protein